MTTKVMSLPTSLLLLVHLHILEYPHANTPEYDHDLFNPRTRGLRERAKTMEDVTYFLVGKIEGKGVRTILSVYPCLQPAESLAFRTSLTKYLEALRHQCIYPSSEKANMKKSLKAPDSALWWKDVVVRKSLIEECSGEKFERLILSLSTHALMKVSRSIPIDNMIMLFHTQPLAYTNALAEYQAKRRAWTKSVSILMRSEYDLKLLHDSLTEVALSKYATLSTDRIQALAESKRQAFLQSQWAGEERRNAFLFLVELAGLNSASSRKDLSVTNIAIEAVPKPTGFPYPLPVAAAHHPTHLKRLRRPIFPDQSKSKPENVNASGTIPPRSHAEIILAEQVDSEKRMRQMLADSISRTKTIGARLNAKVESVTPIKPATTALKAKFWTRPSTSYKTINFDSTPGKDLALSLGLKIDYEYDSDDHAREDALEKKIDQIRNSILSPYPSMPDQSALRKPPLDQEARRPTNSGGVNHVSGKSKIPQTKLTATATRDQRTEPIALSSSSNANPDTDRPGTLLMSPGKSSRSIRRKSVRFSMVKLRMERERPSMFRVFSGGLDDEVEKLVDETNDFPTDDEDTEGDSDEFTLSPFKIPKSKAKVRPAMNRIWTAGTPTSGKKYGQGTPKPRVPSALTRMLDMEPSVGLPRLPSSSSSQFGVFGNGEGGLEADRDSDDDGHQLVDIEATPRPAGKTLPRRSSGGLNFLDVEDDEDEEEEEDMSSEDPPSMTLKDMLLSADTSHFDLLDASTEDIGEGMLVEDASFVWE